MKNLLILILLCSSSAFAGENDLKEHGLKGNVKNVKEIFDLDYELMGEKKHSTTLIRSEYDGQGRLLRQEISSVDEPVGSLEEITYKYEGRFLTEKENTYTYPGNNKKTNYHYDRQGRLISETTIPTGDVTKAVTTIKYTYTAEGKIYEKTTFSDEGGMKDQEKEKVQHKYNDAGLLLATYFYDYDTKTYWKDCEYAYDAKGNTTSVSHYLPEGGIWNKSEHELSEDGAVEKTVVSNYAGNKKQELTRYDKKDTRSNYLYSESQTTKMKREIEYYK